MKINLVTASSLKLPLLISIMLLYLVELSVFLDFFYTLGFKQADTEDLKRFFEHFAETKTVVADTAIKSPSKVSPTKTLPAQPITVRKISMRALLYNYKVI